MEVADLARSWHFVYVILEPRDLCSVIQVSSLTIQSTADAMHRNAQQATLLLLLPLLPLAGAAPAAAAALIAVSSGPARPARVFKRLRTYQLSGVP